MGKTVTAAQIDSLAANAPEGVSREDIVAELKSRGHTIAENPTSPAQFGQGALAATGAGIAGGLASGAIDRFGQELQRSRTLRAGLAHADEGLAADKGPVGGIYKFGKGVVSARSQPRVSPHLEQLGQSIRQVPEGSLPPIETIAPGLTPAAESPGGAFGGQTLSTAPSFSQSTGVETPTSTAAASFGQGQPPPIPSRPIDVQGRPGARAPAQTATYSGGRGKSGPKLAETKRQLEQVRRGESVTSAGPSAQPGSPKSSYATALEESMRSESVPKGAHQVSFGKNGQVIGAVGDEARVAGRAARSVEELGKLAAKVAAKVPRSAREAVFKTVKAASKFANEADTALGGPAMLFFDLLPKSTMEEIMNTHFTVDPVTGKIVKRVDQTGA